jgi:hypothetical protein
MIKKQMGETVVDTLNIPEWTYYADKGGLIF